MHLQGLFTLYIHKKSCNSWVTNSSQNKCESPKSQEILPPWAPQDGCLHCTIGHSPLPGRTSSSSVHEFMILIHSLICSVNKYFLNIYIHTKN